MVIKKYKASTEKEAIELAKEDLGPDAIVMNIKTIKPGGLFRIFKKSKVELTAAIDENMEKEKQIARKTPEKEEQTSKRFNSGFASKDKEDKEPAGSAIEEKINSIAKLIEEQMSSQRAEADRERAEKKQEKTEQLELKKTENTAWNLNKSKARSL